MNSLSLAKLPKDAFRMYTLILFRTTQKKYEISRFVPLAGENVISNRETEIAKLWSPGTYHRRALDCFQMLKLKSGGLRDATLFGRRARLKMFYFIFIIIPIAHRPPRRRHPTRRRRRRQRRDHRREIKDYRQPPDVFIRNQLQGFRASPPPVATQPRCTSTSAAPSTHRRWKR